MKCLNNRVELAGSNIIHSYLNHTDNFLTTFSPFDQEHYIAVYDVETYDFLGESGLPGFFGGVVQAPCPDLL